MNIDERNVIESPRETTVFISCIMPVRNEGKYIRDVIEQLCGQVYPRSAFEIVVIDGLSTDNTVDEVRDAMAAHSDVSIKLLSNPRLWSSAARNIGISQSQGDYILVVDGHVELPSKHMLRDAAMIVCRTGARVLGRPQRLTPTGLTPFQCLIASARACPLGHAGDSFVYSDYEGYVSPASVAVMYERTIFSEFGFFDETFSAVEDLEFNSRLERAGVYCFTSPRLGVLYYPRASVKALFNQMRRYGAGRSRLHRKSNTYPSLTAAAPALALILGIVTMTLAICDQRAQILLFSAIFAYMSIVALFWAKSQHLRQFSYIRVVGVLGLIHTAVGFGLLQGALQFTARRDQQIHSSR